MRHIINSRKRTTRILTTLALALSSAALSANAAQFDFYKLGRGAGDFLPTDGIGATGGDLASSNVDGGVFGDDLTFTSGGITLHATGTFTPAGGPLQTASVVQDHESGWDATHGAGLGVYKQQSTPIDTSDDNITRGEQLTITFDSPVNITRIELRAEGHNIDGWNPGDTFLLNGVSTLLPDGIGFLDVNLSGTVFTFAFDNAQTDLASQFYLGALTASGVPDGGATALLLGGSILGMLGLRKRLVK